MKNEDYYSVLGVPRDASPDEIHAAYRRACVALHPDKHSPSLSYPAGEAFLRVSRAHAVLADARLRPVYDALGTRGVESAQALVLSGVEDVRAAVAQRSAAARGAWRIAAETLRVRADVSAGSIHIHECSLGAGLCGALFPLPTEREVSVGLPAPWSWGLGLAVSPSVSVRRGLGAAGLGARLSLPRGLYATASVGFARSVGLGCAASVGPVDVDISAAQPFAGGSTQPPRVVASVSLSRPTWGAQIGCEVELDHVVTVVPSASVTLSRSGVESTVSLSGSDGAEMRTSVPISDEWSAVASYDGTLCIGLQRQVTSETSVAASIEAGSEWGSGVRLDVVSRRRKIGLSLRLSEDAGLGDIALSAATVVLSAVATQTLTHWLGRRWQHYERSLLSDPKQIDAAIARAQAENDVLGASIGRTCDRVLSTGGLLVTSAIYTGPLGSIDVRWALQRLVADDALVVPPGPSGFDPSPLLGFADVGPNALLSVCYAFRSARHETRISAGAPHALLLPQRTHIVHESLTS